MAASENKRSDVPYLMQSPGLRPRASVLAVAAALVATSCSVLPPSLRKEEPTKTITGATEVTPQAGAAAMQPPPSPSAQQPNRLFSGTGVFVNPNPPAPAPPPGP